MSKFRLKFDTVITDKYNVSVQNITHVDTRMRPNVLGQKEEGHLHVLSLLHCDRQCCLNALPKPDIFSSTAPSGGL